MEIKVYNFAGKRIPLFRYFLNECKTERNKKRPLIVFLHGAGERGGDPEKLFVHGLPKYIRQGRMIPAVVLAPQCPEGYVWNQLTAELKELIDVTVKEYDIDTDRISITGISMGGYGTWEMGMSYPGFFSALGPVCGGGLSWRSGLIGKTPVWAVHGDADTVVPPNNSIEMCDKLNSVGGRAELTILHGVAHNSWEFAYERTTIIDWLLAHKKSDNE